MGMMGGGRPDLLDVTTLPQYAGTDTLLGAAYRGARPGYEDQYQIARQNVLGSMPRGGGLTDALASVELGRARDISGLGAQMEQQRQATIMGIIEDMMSKAYGYAMGAPQQAMTGLGGPASNLANMQAARLGTQQPWTRSMADIGNLGLGVYGLFG